MDTEATEVHTDPLLVCMSLVDGGNRSTRRNPNKERPARSGDWEVAITKHTQMNAHLSWSFKFSKLKFRFMVPSQHS